MRRLFFPPMSCCKLRPEGFTDPDPTDPEFRLRGGREARIGVIPRIVSKARPIQRGRV